MGGGELGEGGVDEGGVEERWVGENWVEQLTKEGPVSRPVSVWRVMAGNSITGPLP